MLQPALIEVLDVLFGYTAIPHSTLMFTHGSQQMLHRDGPYFATRPDGAFVGVWMALEDIHIDSGPLLYVPKSHRLEISNRRSVPRPELIKDYWTEAGSACESAGLQPEPLLGMRKGDVAIWHGLLVHGGMHIEDPTRTRRSLVVHYKAGRIPLCGPDEFFGITRFPDDDPTPYVEVGGRPLADSIYTSLDAGPEPEPHL